MTRFFNARMCIAAGLAVVTQLGCGPSEPETDSAPSTARRGSALSIASLPTLNTFILDSIQIDQLGSGLTPDDANLYLGNDPADGTASVNKPLPAPGAFIDWDNLKNDIPNHRIQDLNLPVLGKDPSSFPHANECVGTSNVLTKMDLTYVAAANNEEWAYFAVQRSGNNGDAGYYWLFTKLPPRMIDAQFPCVAGETRLLYDISMGDVLLAGHFQPGKTALLTVYRAVQPATSVPAVNAINFQSSTWQLDPNGVGAVAVNTTVTAPDSLGSDGVVAMSGANLGPEIFAESAVPVSVFTGGNNCGAVFYGSVITRSSGSGGTSPDLKDLAGPALFNFGAPVATATLQPTCGLDVHYQASAETLGNPIANAICDWNFVGPDGAPTATLTGSCSGTFALPPGSHTATVTVRDPRSSICAATTTLAPITVYPPVEVTAELVGGCEGTFQYSAVGTGGTEQLAYFWSFTGGEGIIPASSTDPSGTVTVGKGAVPYEGVVVVTDVRPDGLTCTATALGDAVVYMPTSATARLRPTCTLDVVYEVTSTSGGAGTSIPDPLCEWTFDDGSTALGCSGVFPGLSAGGHTASVRVTDPLSTCGATVITAPITTYPPLAVRASLEGSCQAAFHYLAAASGGTGNASYAWSFEGGGVVNPSSSTSASGTAAVGTGAATYVGTVTARDARSDGLDCTATASDDAVVYMPTTVSARLVPTCGLEVGYELASATGGAGTSIANPSCEWQFDGITVLDPGCTGNVTLHGSSPSGTLHVGTVTVKDPDVSLSGEGCQATDSETVLVYSPLSVTADLAGNCTGSFLFSAEAAGGSGHLSYQWAFTGAGTMSVSGSPDPSGEVTVSAGNEDYAGTIVVTDHRPDGLSCPATASDVTRVFMPIKVHLARASAGPTCPGMQSDSAEYVAVPSGGSGNYQLSWSGAACAGPTCTVDPPEEAFCYSQSFSVTASDQATDLCPAATSETETYTKITIVSASDN